MTTIQITKKNNIYATIHSEDRGFLMSIYEQFSRYVKGYVFAPKYKAGVWDGKIKFFNRMTGEIYLGIVNRVIEYCREEGARVNIDPAIVDSFYDSSIDKDEIFQFIDNLNVSDYQQSKMNWRDYQKSAVFSIISRKRRMIASPTSSGKSAIIYASCRFLLERKIPSNKKIIIIVPTIGLIRQMKSDFAEYSFINQWDTEGIVSEYGGGKKETSGRIIVSTWQSIYKKDSEWFDQFDVMMVDEAHEATAASLVDIGKKCNARYRIGLSGSFVDDDETTEMTLNGLFGNRTVTITTREMIDKGYASDMIIKCVQLNHNDGFNKKVEYHKEIEFLATSDRRNKFILDTAEETKGNTLILFQLVEKHGKPLFKLARETSKKKVFFIYGGTDVDEREQIRKILEKEKDAILFASYKTFATGSNVKNLENIIFGSPTKSYRRVIQSIGRGLRLNKGKTHCTLYDVFDYIHGDKKDIKSCNHTFQHFVERLSIYVKEKHKYEVTSETL